jgi:tetratricopeptide (TPR) repeat protein
MSIFCLCALLLQAAAPTPYETGMAHFQRHEFPQAAAAFEAAIQGERIGTKAYRDLAFLLGQSYFQSGNNPEAIAWLEKSGALHLEALYMLGGAAIRNREPYRARKAFGDMFGVAEDSAAAHLITAQMMVRQDFDAFAEKELRRALELDARIPEAHYLLGVLAILRSDLDRAVAELTAELKINPNFAPAYYKLGDALLRRERWDEAIPLLRKSMWLNPNTSAPYILLGKGYLKRNELPSAESMLRRAVQMDPTNFSANFLLGETLNKLGKTEEGRTLLERSQTLRKTREEQ